MINDEQAGVRTQQIMEAQLGQLILQCARMRAEREQVDQVNATLMAENAALKAELDTLKAVPVGA